MPRETAESVLRVLSALNLALRALEGTPVRVRVIGWHTPAEIGRVTNVKQTRMGVVFEITDSDDRTFWYKLPEVKEIAILLGL